MGKQKQFYLGNESLPTNDATFEYTPKMLREIKHCSKKVAYFAENYFHITHPDQGKIKIKLYKAQKRVIKSLVNNRFVVVLASRQIGKALALDTPIRTPEGWKKMGDLKDGDQVYDEQGNICNILKAHDILHNRKCYEIVFDNGEKIKCDAEHLWFTQTKKDWQKKPYSIGSVKTTEEIKQTLKVKVGDHYEPNHRIPVSKAIKGKKQQLSIEPYLLGYWLGDGWSYGAHIYVEKSILEESLSNLYYENYDYTVRPDGDNYKICISGQGSLKSRNGLNKKLKDNNLIKNKHIPREYFNSTYKDRLELLQGLIDSDGYVNKYGGCEFTSVFKQLADDVEELIISLGFKVYRREYVSKYGTKKCKKVYNLFFTPDVPVCKLTHKKQRLKKKIHGRSKFHYIKEIKEIKSIPVRCITVDSPNSLYLCGKQNISTHNTTLMTIYALWICCFNSDQRITIVANKEDTAIEILDRVRMAYEMLPNWLKPGVKGNWGKKSITFANDSKINISTTTATTARGKTGNILIIDEMAHIPPHIISQFWKSVIPIISSSKRGKIFAVSTPNGTGNLFYQIYTAAERGKGIFKKERVDWWEVPGRDEQWVEEQKQLMISEGKDFDQEFGNVFVESGTSPIDGNLLNKFRRIACPPKYIFDDGHYKVWKPPVKEHLYAFGVDVADGIGENASVVEVTDITDLTHIELVAVYHNNKIDPYHFATELNKMANQWGKPPILIERNNMGGQVIDALYYTHHYPYIVDYTPEKQKYYNKLGIYSHANAKNKGVTNMRYWVNSLQCVDIYDIETVQELETFIRYPNGTWKARAGENLFDDRVMALIWNLLLLEPELLEQYYEILDYDKNGKPLRIKPFHIQAPEFYNLNSFYQTNADAPLPAFLGSDPAEVDEMNLSGLLQKGWKPLNTVG